MAAIQTFPAWLDLLLVLIAAFGAGLIDAMAGGGGLVQTPALFAVFPDIAHPTLLGTGKIAGLGGTTSALFRYARSVKMPWRLAAPVTLATLLASVAGAYVTTRIPPDIFRPLVPFMLTAVFLYVVWHRDFGAVHAPATPNMSTTLFGFIFGSLVGFYDGFFGPGTGTFLMFFFVRCFALDFLHASAAAKLANCAANLGALTMFGFKGQVIWALGLAMMTCNVGGAAIGSHLAIRHGSRLVRKVFLVVVSALIAKTAWDAIVLLAHGP